MEFAPLLALAAPPVGVPETPLLLRGGEVAFPFPRRLDEVDQVVEACIFKWNNCR